MRADNEADLKHKCQTHHAKDDHWAFASMKNSACLLGLLVVCASAIGAGCGARPAPGQAPAGTIGLALDFSSGVALNEATYTITGPNAYSRSVKVPLGNAPTLSTLIGGTPPGRGYVLSVVGVANDGVTTCSGVSVPFDVVAGQTTMVSLRLQCHEQERTGNIQVGGVANYCAVVDDVTASSTQAVVGQPITLTSATRDRNNAPAPISFLWSATGGAISDTRVANPTFTCTTPGIFTINLTITDGDCGDSHVVTVTCTAAAADASAPPPPDAGAPDASGPEGGATSGDPCLACVSSSTNPACQVRYYDCVNLPGEAIEGPSAGSARNALCLDVLTCVHTTRCDRGAGGLRDCFCGAGVSELACQGSATGVCRVAFHAAGESNDNGNVMARMNDATFALGAASDLIRECEEKPAPLCGPSCGF